LQSSIERQDSKKVIKIDISELRRSIEKQAKDKLTLQSTSSPRLQLRNPRSPSMTSRQLGRKVSAATCRNSDREVYVEEMHTLPELRSFPNTAQKITSFERLLRPSLHELCYSE
jgi:hypothetical protein